MSIKDIISKIFGGKKLEDLGVNAVIDQLKGLTAEGDDKKSINDIIAALKKLIGNKDQLASILAKVKEIAGGISDGDLKEKVLGIINLIKK